VLLKVRSTCSSQPHPVSLILAESGQPQSFEQSHSHQRQQGTSGALRTRLAGHNNKPPLLSGSAGGRARGGGDLPASSLHHYAASAAASCAAAASSTAPAHHLVSLKPKSPPKLPTVPEGGPPPLVSAYGPSAGPGAVAACGSSSSVIGRAAVPAAVAGDGPLHLLPLPPSSAARVGGGSGASEVGRQAGPLSGKPLERAPAMKDGNQPKSEWLSCMPLLFNVLAGCEG
jgi:hypothetical protein